MGRYLVYKKLNESNELSLQQSFDTLEDAENFVASSNSDIIEYRVDNSSVILYGGIQSYTIPPIQAMKISKMQAALALAISGKLDMIENAIKAKGGLYWLAWNYADSIEISSPMLLGIWDELGLTFLELQQLFNFAYSLKP